ncbi:hypothetical protein L9G15_24020, partial [Shewanella sp. A3A]|nr:hypothetical protein [Shewanella ferrihydritica]
SNAASGHKDDFSESLWVSRLLPKTPMKVMDTTRCDEETDFCSANPKGLGDCSSPQDFNVEKELNNSQYFTSKGSDNETTSSKCAAPQD